MAKAGDLTLGLPSSARFDSFDAWFAALEAIISSDGHRIFVHGFE